MLSGVSQEKLRDRSGAQGQKGRDVPFQGRGVDKHCVSWSSGAHGFQASHLPGAAR